MKNTKRLKFEDFKIFHRTFYTDVDADVHALVEADADDRGIAIYFLYFVQSR